MHAQKQKYIRNIYNVIFKRKKNDLIKFFLISTPGSLAALFEGLTFSLLLSSLYILNGRGLDVFKGKPIISKIAEVSFIQELDPNYLFIVILLAALTSQIIKSLLIYISSAKAAKLSAKISSELYKNLVEHLLSFNFQTISNYKIGKLTTYTQAPTNSILPLLQALHKVIIQFCILITLSFLLFKISIPLTFFFMGFFFLAGFVYKKVIMAIHRYSQKCADQVIRISNNIVQTISGIKLIHIFGMQKTVLNKNHQVMGNWQEYQRKIVKSQSFLFGIGEIFSMIMMAATLIISAFFLIVTQEHSLPLLLTYLAISYRFSTTAREILTNLGIIAAQTGPVIKLNEILTLEDKEFEARSGNPSLPIKKGIEFIDVSFKYPQKKDDALNRISINIPHKKMTAIVGLSGAGKSSLISLITRLFDPTSGKILVDGIPLNDFNITSWRKKLGVVPQNTFIFNDSARENISFGSKVTDKEIFEACRIAGCLEMIEKFPDGIDSFLGEHGYKISGGEAQRIAIARALIRKPELIILDEATSSLDSHNEQLIQNTFDKFRSKCTLIMIAHRLSTIQSSDQIIVLSKGRVSEIGTHNELLEKKGKYAYLWDLQSKKKAISQPAMA